MVFPAQGSAAFRGAHHLRGARGGLQVPPGAGFTRVLRSVNMHRQVPAVLDMPIVVPTSA